MGQAEAPNSKIHNRNFPSRVKASTPLGTCLLVILRLADVFLQYNILRAWGAQAITFIGGSVASLAVDASSSNTILGLPPYYFGLTLCALGAAMKQIIWVTYTSEQEMPVVAALMIATFNTVFNSVNAMLSIWAWSSAATQQPLKSISFIVGATIFTIGILFEQISEIQRKNFKSDPENKGMPYAGGLFSIALNINYGGYTLWRAGYACLAAGFYWGGFIGIFFFYDFYARAIPILDKYCIERVSQASDIF